MILRKPYALLIKHFKKIHLILCIFMIYIAYQCNNILTFFNEYISTSTFTRTTYSLSSTYINIYMFLGTVTIAVVALAIYILMRQKNKPKLLYIIIIAFYLALVIYFFQIYNTLDIIEISSISPRSLRIIRDLSSVICYVQYFIILFIAVRAVGFNIKKFNFGEDLEELEIDVSDNEEFELTVGIDPNKIVRSLRRGKREFKYFIVENFFILSLILFGVIISFSIGIFMNKEVYNKIYNETEAFKASYFVNTVNNSYYTHINQKGEKISPSGIVFAVTSVTFNNKDTYPRQINLDDINLVSGDDIFSPIITNYRSFNDLGTGYTNQIIEPGTSSTFIFVFEVNESTNLNKLMFRYRESLKISTTRLESKYKKVKLDGALIDEITKMDEVNIQSELAFASTSLGKTKLKVTSAEYADTFIYDATYCYSGVCSVAQSDLTLIYTTTQKTLLKLAFSYIKDKNADLINSNTLEELINSYGFIRYNYNGKIYDYNLIDKTPINYVGPDLYYQVPSDVKNAQKIELVFHIRNKEFVYNLK